MRAAFSCHCSARIKLGRASRDGGEHGIKTGAVYGIGLQVPGGYLGDTLLKNRPNLISGRVLLRDQTYHLLDTCDDGGFVFEIARTNRIRPRCLQQIHYT